MDYRSIDAPAHSARGATRFVVMVALFGRGQAVSGWIWQPIDQRMYTASWAGRTCDGIKIEPRPTPRTTLAEMTGDVRTTFFVDQQRLELLQRFQDKERVVVDRGGACGYVYPELATGELDFTVFGRQYPGITRPERFCWRNPAGAARDLSGSAYEPTHTTWGLLSVSHRNQWEAHPP